MQPGTLQLAPSDAREIPRYQAQQDAAPRQPLKHRPTARAMFVVQFRAHAQVVTLRCFQDLRHGLNDGLARGARRTHHHGQNVRVQHPLHGDAFGGGIEPRDPPYTLDQRGPVVRSGAADQSAVDVE